MTHPVYVAALARVGDTNGDGYWRQAGRPDLTGAPWGGVFVRECLTEAGYVLTPGGHPYWPRDVLRAALRAGYGIPDPARAVQGDIAFLGPLDRPFACAIVDHATPEDVHYIIGNYQRDGHPPMVAHARYPTDRVTVVRPRPAS